MRQGDLCCVGRVEGGVGKLYRHQAELAQAAWEGEDAVIATGTSSGKSLGYQLPILSRLAQEPTACALYLTPTKALGSDQLQAVLELCPIVGPNDPHERLSVARRSWASSSIGLVCATSSRWVCPTCRFPCFPGHIGASVLQVAH